MTSVLDDTPSEGKTNMDVSSPTLRHCLPSRDIVVSPDPVGGDRRRCEQVYHTPYQYVNQFSTYCSYIFNMFYISNTYMCRIDYTTAQLTDMLTTSSYLWYLHHLSTTARRESDRGHRRRTKVREHALADP